MAKGIEFYRDYANIASLKDSKQTQLFTETIWVSGSRRA